MTANRGPLLFAILTVALFTWMPAQLSEGAAPPVHEPGGELHLYLLIGQSNMAGRGRVAEEDRTPHPRVLVLDRKDKWVPAVDPLHFDKPIAGVGPGLAFGKAMAEADRTVRIGLIPCAAGGSPIEVWKKGAFWEQTRSKPYDEMLRRVAVAGRRGRLRGILWHQGESDSEEEAAKLYAARLTDLVARLRRDLEAPEVPFLIGGLSTPLRATSEPARTVDRALRQFAARDAHSAYVDSEGLTLLPDHIHFDAVSARELGRRYARALLSAQKK
jgi:Carbohydrate esterase, sialic acid-specific acetylesterase